MPLAAMIPTPKTYAQLRDAVIAVVVRGRREIDRAWLDTYHETGRLINEHILRFRDRADFGARVYEKLAEDTGISVRTLRQCAQFQRYYPIRHARAELNWGHYQLLVQVADDTQRKRVEADAIRNRWTTRELETRVRDLNALAIERDGRKDADAGPVELLTPRRGTPGLHPIVDRGNGPVVDLGFKLYRALATPAKFTTRDIVRLDENGVRRIDDATRAELFTYTATIRRVIDGDTLLGALLVAPDITLELKLRLRGLDCPELSTAAGRAAKRFVDAMIHAGDEVILSTTKPDKYDRYLADVFVPVRDESEPGSRRAGSASQLSSLNSQPAPATFLNNALLESGHAVRYDGVGEKGG